MRGTSDIFRFGDLILTRGPSGIPRICLLDTPS